jgi:carboxymethylenebutenolidase
LEAKLKEHKVDAQFVYYPNVGHAFMNRDRPEVYNAEIAAKAKAQAAEFLKKSLA